MKTIPPQETTIQYIALTSLNQAEYVELLEVFSGKVSIKLSRYTLKGAKRKRSSYSERSNSSLYGSALKLEFLLMYLKDNFRQEVLAYMFQISQAKVSEWLSFLLPVLYESLDELGVCATFGCHFDAQSTDCEYFIGDVVERDVPRKRCYQAQKAEYSGKKKRHTNKHFALVDSSSYVHFLSPQEHGSVHDKTIWDGLDIVTQGQPIFLDLGFLGADKDIEEVMMPFKKSKYKPLTDLKKLINKEMSKIRVRVEHAFAGIKRLRIIQDKIRVRGEQKREIIMRIATALHNFRVKRRDASSPTQVKT